MSDELVYRKIIRDQKKTIDELHQKIGELKEIIQELERRVAK